ncbi:MAG TPA: ABC transporter ATP-binding protein [Luteibaculaceae bacterium]|nr:ABC transporter ATP-binding protein [Luteibaculaceae bacterium]
MKATSDYDPSQLVQVEDLSKSFGDFKAVDRLSFRVEKGDVYGFLGQNGAGKSTTMRMLLTLIRPDNGNISVFGEKLAHHRESILGRVGAMIEKPDLYKYLSALENLSLFAKLSGCRLSKADLLRQLAVVGLEDRANDKVKHFSQGMKQRLGIAIALVHNPELVMLDEPTNGLDPQGIADIRHLIGNLAAEHKKTVIVSSHLLGEIEQVATRILIIDRGKKIVEGTTRDLLDPTQTIIEIETGDLAKTAALLANSRFNQGVQLKGLSVTLTLPPGEIPALNRFLVDEQVDVYRIAQRNSLENYFLNLTR